MHDPMTVAFEIKSPIKRKSELCPNGYRSSIITIWHVDPEMDGSDDSCDWFGNRRTKANGWYPAALDDYASMSQDTQRAIDFVWWMWRDKLGRPWWKHPKYHFWHWQIQVYFLLNLKRWLWSRCTKCGKRFEWGYAPISNQWDGDGPRWFRGEPGVYHSECYEVRIPCHSPTS
jgi:hypothetical protein